MATYFEIPLTSVPQEFTVSLGGKSYRFNLRWQETEFGGWVIDIADDKSGDNLVCGIPLVTGVDLLAPYSDIGFGGELRVLSNVTLLPAGIDTLGSGVKLYYITPD